VNGRGTSPLKNLPNYQRPPAEKIGKYRILGVLGRGGMGIVYKGLDPDIEREVAIKTIRFDTFIEGVEKEEMLARVIREAKAAGRLDHPNIITVYDVIREGDLTFIVMQYIDGQSLQGLMDGGKRFPPREVIDLLKPVADALDYAHQKGIVHRDIKPANILIDRRLKPFLADFGVARMETSTMTGPGKTIGTLSYMSPEQVMGSTVDHRADLFALGVILYELLTGKKPFAGDNMSTIVYKIVNEEPPNITQINHDLPAGYEDVIRKALAKSPEERYQSGQAMIAALESPEKLAEATRAFGSDRSRPEKSPSHKGRRLALAVGLVVFFVLVAVGYKIRPREGSADRKGVTDLNTVKAEDLSPVTRGPVPAQAAALSTAEDALARLKTSFENKNYEEAIGVARQILGQDPANAQAKGYLDRAIEARTTEQVKPYLERGVARFGTRDYLGCVQEMEQALRLDAKNGLALDYLGRAHKALAEGEIESLIEERRVAEENKALYVLMDQKISSEAASATRFQYREWFNNYDGIKSRIPEKTVTVQDNSSASVSFFQTVSGIDRKDKKKKVIFEGQRTWVLKKADGSWMIVEIR
jgi:serine/threonine protein kinase